MATVVLLIQYITSRILTLGFVQVASFTQENHAITQYEKSLNKAYKSGVQEGLASGLGQGVVFLILFCSYAVALYFGGQMIFEKGYTGGDVINIILAVLIGSK